MNLLLWADYPFDAFEFQIEINQMPALNVYAASNYVLQLQTYANSVQCTVNVIRISPFYSHSIVGIYIVNDVHLSFSVFCKQ